MVMGHGEQTRLLRHDEEEKEPDVAPDFEASPVTTTTTTTTQRTVPWFRVALLFIASSFSLPTFVTGIDIYQTKNALSAILIGNFLLAAIFSLCGTVGARTRLHSYHLANTAFGRKGAAVFNVAFATSLLGWYIVNLNLLVNSVQELLANEQDDATMTDRRYVWVSFLAGLLITVTTICGFWALERLSLLLAPILAMVTILLLQKSWAEQQQQQQQQQPPRQDHKSSVASSVANLDSDTSAAAMSLGLAISSVMGLSIVGAIIASDYTRFVNHWPGAIWTALLAALVTAVVEFSGGWAASVFQKKNMLDIMKHVGLQQEALAILIAGCWILNAMNLYSLALSLEATFPSVPNRHLIGVVGLTGTTLAASCNILDEFLAFLYYLSITFAPVTGVIVMDYYFSRHSIYDSHESVLLHGQAECRLDALLAWTVGVSVTAIGLTGIAALDAFITAAASYLIVTCFFRRHR